jgi:hypothetical protein
MIYMQGFHNGSPLCIISEESNMMPYMQICSNGRFIGRNSKFQVSIFYWDLVLACQPAGW